MFGLFKKKKAKDADAEAAEAEDKAGGKEKKQGEDGEATAEEAAPKKRFGMKFMLIAGGGLLLVLAGAGAGAYFFLFSKPKTAEMAQASAIPLVPPTVAYMDMSNIIVNIQTADGTPAYLKLSVSLELNTPEEKAGLQVLMPRVVDQFQGYLRELRVDDLRGSAGVMRLKEELLRRINVAAAPYRVRDVLLKEMIVQ
ncbi:MAG TPA: flagellar basal body-associated FliL family protein [Rhizomicrobium sp.]